MLRVIVHVKLAGEMQGVDLEVPAEVPARELCAMILRALERYAPGSSVPAEHGIRSEASRKILRGEESLADAGLWDGSCLVLEPSATARTEDERSAFLESTRGSRYMLSGPEMRVGRSWPGGDATESDERFVDLRREPGGDTVSRNHARLIGKGSTWELVACAKTTNPTFVQDRLAEPEHPYPLSDGDSLRFGDVRLYFRLSRR